MKEKQTQDLNTSIRITHTSMQLELLESDKPQEKIFSILFEQDEITWQSMIYELVRTEGMNPWDVDISLITQKFLEMLRKLKEMDFRISGKVVLASAILLKLKSNKLIEEDITALDSLMSSAEETPEEFLDELLSDDFLDDNKEEKEKPKLVPRTPQPRKRKVSVYDLVKALEKALVVEKRRPEPIREHKKITKPSKGKDISEVIKEVYANIQTHYNSKKIKGPKLTFTDLIPSESKEDKIFTFIPLLHLENQRRIDTFQEMHFGEIEIELLKRAK
jgi:segregation and condensation protein A